MPSHVGSLSANRGGELWLNPGRLIEGGAFDDDDVARYGDLVGDHLPEQQRQAERGPSYAYPLVQVDTEEADVFLG